MKYLIKPVYSRIFVKLFSGAGTGFTYTFQRKRTSPKMELRKYDPLGIFIIYLYLHLFIKLFVKLINMNYL